MVVTPETIQMTFTVIAAVIAIASTFGTWAFLADRQKKEPQPMQQARPYGYTEIQTMVKQAIQQGERNARKAEEARLKGHQYRGDILP